MKRRSFLGMGLAAALAQGCKGETPPVAPRPWGTPEAYEAFAMLDSARRPERMLEIFCLGGMSPWESFYAVPGRNQPGSGDYAEQQWWLWQESERLSVPDFGKQCLGLAPGSLLHPWTTDGLGNSVHLGPFVHALKSRPDMLARMRVWVMAHNTEPHENAIPYAISGHELGDPRLASLGAHLERYHREGGDPARTAPYAYAIAMSSLDVSGNGPAAWSIGQHGPSARPMPVQLGRELRLHEQLARARVLPFRNQLDELVAYHTQQFRARLTSATSGQVRAPGLDDLALAQAALRNHEGLARMLPEQLLASKEIELCIPDPLEMTHGPVLDETSTAIELARHLLTDTITPARYVQVLDAGIFTDPAGQGYDAHSFHVETQGPNLDHMLRGLIGVVNEPGENDPSKLDLDRDFVLLNTEFGRAPYREVSLRNPYGFGSDHWPWGYVVVGFGGFIDSERSGLVGSIGADGRAVDGLTPSEHRAAMLLANGAWPFSTEAFNVGDIRGATTELEAALILRERVLGYSA